MGHRGALCLAYFAAPLVPIQWGHSGAIVGRGAIPSAITSALHCADYMLRCALPTRAHIHHTALSSAIPRAIPLLLLSFESYLEMMLQE